MSLSTFLSNPLASPFSQWQWGEQNSTKLKVAGVLSWNRKGREEGPNSSPQDQAQCASESHCLLMLKALYPQAELT